MTRVLPILYIVGEMPIGTVELPEDELEPIERALEQLLRLNASRKVHTRRSAAAGAVISQPGFQLLRRIEEGDGLPDR